jgi:hypothetical protein
VDIQKLDYSATGLTFTRPIRLLAQINDEPPSWPIGPKMNLEFEFEENVREERREPVKTGTV